MEPPTQMTSIRHERVHVSSARFQPWVGSQYSTTGWAGLKLLIVGESFWEEPGDNLAQYPNLTSDVVRRAIDTPSRDLQFYGNIQLALTGQHLETEAEREAFWNRVAFLNYFQRVMGWSNEPPTSRDKKEAAPIFVEALEALRPDAVLVVSTTVWGAMGKLPGVTSTLFQPDSAFEIREWHRECRPSILATWTYHPSYWGANTEKRFTGPATRERIQRFLNSARRGHSSLPIRP